MHVLLSRLARWSESQPAPSVLVVGACAVAGIGYADYVTGAHLSFAVFYLMPVSFATWYGNRYAAVLISVCATLSWFAADFYTHPVSATAAAPYWNTSVRLLMFLFVASLLLSIRRFSETLRRTVDERTRLLRQEIEEHKRTEARLAMLGQAVESTVEMICITDAQNRFVFANRAFLEGFGYSAAEIIGRTPEMLVSSANPPQLVAEILEQTRSGGWRGELINRRRDGSDFPAFLSTSRLLDREGRIVGLMGITQDITERRRAEDELQRQASALRTEVERRAVLEREMAELTTEEHHRVARDLHDGAGQYLAGLSFHARILAEELDAREAPEREQARRLEELIRATNRELRQLDKILRPATSELGGLPAALRRLVEEVAQMVGVRCTLRMPETWFPLPDFPALMLFRIAQEALNNALKHGQGRSVEITLELASSSSTDVSSMDSGAAGLSDAGVPPVGLDRRGSSGPGVPPMVSGGPVLSGMGVPPMNPNSVHSLHASLRPDPDPCSESSMRPPTSFDAPRGSSSIGTEGEPQPRPGATAAAAATVDSTAPSWLILSVVDAGPGLANTAPTEGDGLRIMRYRAQLIGAQLELRSRPGKGCEVRCELPLDRRNGVVEKR